jgi:diguanylate cyclase (GGDEF)-like protein
LYAHSGQEGLEILSRNEVHVIVSDQRMPGMTGVEFLSRAKELCPNTVRIILSGFADLSSVTEAINRGAIYKFLTKPWDNETLCANVLEAFRHYELTQQRKHLALEIQEANTTLASLSLELSKLLSQRDSQIDHITKFDHLTNLPNRWVFIDRLNQSLGQTPDVRKLVSLLLIDVDHFNYINESIGYTGGDELLKAVSERLSKFTGENDTLARIGSDEFGFLFTDLKSNNEAETIAQQIINSFSGQPVNIGSKETNIGVSIGISQYPSDGADSHSLIKNASVALRNAKSQGNCYVMYSSTK